MPYGLKDIELEKLSKVFATNERLERVVLYGSRAKGNYKPFSDVDITLMGEKLTHSDLNRISLAVDDLLLPYQFDISIFHTLKNEALIDHIHRIGITIYERENEWKEYKLGDLTVDGKGSYGIAAPAVDYDANKYTYLRITDINDDGTLNKNGLKSVDDKNSYKYLLQQNDIVFARTGASVGRSYFYDEKDGELVYAGFLIKYSIDPSKVNPKILKFYTHSQAYYDWIQTVDNGATRGNINAQMFASMPIILPVRQEQDRIVTILSSLDDKIDLLRRENATLEAMAETLFRQWFVEEAKEDEVAIGDVVKTTSGGTPSRKQSEYYENGTICWVKSKELDGTFISSTEEMITEEAVAKSSAKMLPAKSVLIAMYGATVGEYGILSKPMTCNQAVCALIPNENYPFTYLFMWTATMKQEFINLATGAAQQNISQDLIKQQFVTGDTDKIKKYDELVRGYFDKMENNQKQIQTLIQTRDELLPRLMSGEVKV